MIGDAVLGFLHIAPNWVRLRYNAFNSIIAIQLFLFDDQMDETPDKSGSEVHFPSTEFHMLRTAKKPNRKSSKLLFHSATFV